MTETQSRIHAQINAQIHVGAAARLDALRADRSRALAQRGRTTAAAAATRSYLVCVCGPDGFGLPLGEVEQVLPMRPVTPLPDAPTGVLGLIALSGRIVSLLALASTLGRPPASGPAPGNGAGHVVVLRGATASVALAVDRVLGVAEIPEGVLDTAGAEAGLNAEAIVGYAPAGAGPGAESAFLVVDLPRLLRRYLP